MDMLPVLALGKAVHLVGAILTVPFGVFALVSENPEKVKAAVDNPKLALPRRVVGFEIAKEGKFHCQFVHRWSCFPSLPLGIVLHRSMIVLGRLTVWGPHGSTSVVQATYAKSIWQPLIDCRVLTIWIPFYDVSFLESSNVFPESFS